MTTPHAAAERLRRLRAGEDAKEVYAEFDIYGGAPMTAKMISDTYDVNTAYLSEHPASDADAITAERLEAMGATRRITDKLHLALRDETAVHGGWRVGFKCPVDDYQTNTAWIPLWLRTMGDVRKLLEGLGVNLP